jgi:hypothetical protein
MLKFYLAADNLGVWRVKMLNYYLARDILGVFE